MNPYEKPAPALLETKVEVNLWEAGGAEGQRTEVDCPRAGKGSDTAEVIQAVSSFIVILTPDLHH